MISLRSDTGISPGLAGWLDLARGLAAVEVLAFHSYQLMFMERVPTANYAESVKFAYSTLWALSGHGVSAVMVFFVLSGYLVGGPALVRAHKGRLSGIDYFSARAARLYVVLIPALTVSFCAYVSARQLPGWGPFVASHQDVYDGARIFSGQVSPAAALCNVFFLQTITCPVFAGNMALWSLSNEFWYYVLFFALISVRKTTACGLLIALIFGLFVLAERLDATGTHVGLKFFFYFAIWVFGVLVYATVATARVWACMLTAGVFAIYLLSIRGLLPQWAAVQLAVGLATGTAILGLDYLRLSLPSFLKFGLPLAKFSFSLYAIHYPILLLLNVLEGGSHREFTFASIGLNASFMLSCLLLAFVFYLLFESHTSSVRKWLQRGMSRGFGADAKVLSRVPAVESLTSFGMTGDHGVSGMQYVDILRGARRATSSERPAASDLSQGANRARVRASEVPWLLLNDGHSIPQLGFGVWQIEDGTAPAVVGRAIDAGYRLIDTATDYGNEAGVGQAIAKASVPRSELFITTKLWNESHGYDQTMRAFDASAARLNLDVIDLYLIHWPCPQRRAYVDTWRAFIELREQGCVKSIGVSNFTADQLERIIDETGVVPAVNQIELHPAFQQSALRQTHERYGIVTQAWSPLGRGSSLITPRLQMIADRHSRTPAQIVLRWHIENQFVVIPKSATPSRIAENIDVFDFELTTGDHAMIAGLDRVNGRIGPDPMTFGQVRFARRLLNLVRRRCA